MSSQIRSRSVSRIRVVKQSSDFASGECLDPFALLEDILKELKDTSAPLSVTIKDKKRSVSFLLSTFLSKEYEIIEGRVLFGGVRLVLDELRVNISFDLSIIPN